MAIFGRRRCGDGTAADPARGPDPGDALRAELRRRERAAIYLRRVWPLGSEAPGHSHLGGLPSLPPHVPWPRGRSTGQPLHFLAQIDCAEMPSVPTDTPLPPDGLLLFFGDIDEEMLWMDDEPGDRTRVLYVPAPQRVAEKQAVPDDMPDIGHAYQKMGGGHARVGVKTYPAWPVTGHAIRSFPVDPSGRSADLETLALEMFAAELKAHLPPPSKDFSKQIVGAERVMDEETADWARDAEGNVVRKPHLNAPFAEDDAFPWCGAVMSEFATALETECASKIAYESQFLDDRAGARSSEHQAKLSGLQDRLEQIQAFAPVLRSLPDCDRPDPDLSARVIHWILTELNAQEANTALLCAVKRVAQRAVFDADLRAVLPPLALEVVDRWIRPSVGQSEHVMLGYPQAKTNFTTGEGVRLLVLDSDYGTDFMFCDCGVVEFYIDPDDLAARDFSRASANTAGG
ncbi:DUF1963 domain-containing protein [Rhodospira trueperi]|uniref:DUF1963 domain-containing protein n=1 Tax=Rhodospira trueperi TaxID=69960 RepID=A0A1G7B416_9PROT|nr:YwqG family protein [Rhodospira trueperi]SDE21702.1 protein of unknown function [Rhodospira trueperi]